MKSDISYKKHTKTLPLEFSADSMVLDSTVIKQACMLHDRWHDGYTKTSANAKERTLRSSFRRLLDNNNMVSAIRKCHI